MKVDNQIFLGDCFELLLNMPKNHFDLVLTDMPYGCTDLDWDKTINLPLFWNRVLPITKDNAVFILFSQQPFTTDLINSRRELYRDEIIWHKTAPSGFLNANRCPLQAHENAIIFSKKGGYNYFPQFTPGKPYFSKKRKSGRGHYGYVERCDTDNATGDRYPTSVQTFKNRNPYHWHPTQKPLDLINFLIKSYSPVGSRVLDPFAGSCVVAKACWLNERHFTCIEAERNYYNRAVKEFANFQTQHEMAVEV